MTQKKKYLLVREITESASFFDVAYQMECRHLGLGQMFPHNYPKESVAGPVDTIYCVLQVVKADN